MKKPKVSLDPKALKPAIIQHVEKVVFGLVILCFLAFVYHALARPSLDWGPTDLSNDASTAKRAIETKEAPQAVVQPPNYGGKAKGMNQVASTPYDWSKAPRDPDFGPSLHKRGLPKKLFPLADLRGTPGCGAFAMADPDDPTASAMAPGRSGYGMSGPPGMGSESSSSMGMGGPPGMMAAQTKGQRWVVITGLFPYKKQIEAFKRSYEDCVFKDPDIDHPAYAYYWVERAEMAPGLNAATVDPAKLAWQPLNTLKSLAIQDYWLSGMPQDVVDPMYFPADAAGADGSPIQFAFPLGPLQNRPWGAEVAHAPEIPVMDLESAMAGMGEGGPYGGPYGPMRRGAKAAPAAKVGEQKTETPADAAKTGAKNGKAATAAAKPPAPAADLPDEPIAIGGAMNMGMGSSEYGSMSGGPPMMGGRRSRMPSGSYGSSSSYGSSPMGRGRMSSGSMSSPYPSSGPYGSGSRGSGMGRSRMGPMGGYSPYGPMGGYGVPEEEPDNLLFRFFDFTVQSGRHYVYRVRIALYNPNYGLSPQCLENEGLAKQVFIDKDEKGQPLWSAPCPPVYVPLDSQVLAMSAKGSRLDPSATVMAVNFSELDGSMAFDEFTAPRGQVLNFYDREFDPNKGQAAMRMGEGSMGMSGPPYSSASSSKRGSAGLSSASGSSGPPRGYPGSGGPPSGYPGSSGSPGMFGPGGPYGLGTAAAAEPKKVDYVTEMLVLDACGGGRLPGKDKAVVETAAVLLLDPNGNLVVRNELDDQPEIELHKPPEGRVAAGASPMSGYDSESSYSSGYPYGGPGAVKGKGSGKANKGKVPPGMGPPYGGMPPGMEDESGRKGGSRRRGGGG